MYTITDTMLALILRFVVGHQKMTFQDDEFVREQLKAIRKHIAQFPEEEQEQRAIEWVETHAREYREDWEKDVVGKTLSQDRCPDCPLARTDDSEHCQIHDEWIELLEKYAADKINSRKYVENALRLLAQNKKDLKIKLSMLKNGQN